MGKTTSARRYVRSLADDATRHALHNLIGRETERLIERGFDTETDPQGRPWQRKIGGGSILQRSGKLKRSTRWRADVRGVLVENKARSKSGYPYGLTHQTGKVIRARRAPYLKFKVGGRWVQTKQVTIPRRTFMPRQEQPLPERYEDAFVEIITDYLERKWRR